MLRGAVSPHPAVPSCTSALGTRQFCHTGHIRIKANYQPIKALLAPRLHLGNARRCTVIAPVCARPAVQPLLASVPLHQSRRGPVAAAARRTQSADAAVPADGDIDFDNLAAHSLAELKAICQDLGISPSGKKADLAQRIQQRLAQQSLGAAVDTAPAAADGVATAGGTAVRSRSEELSRLTLPDLKQQCKELGLSPYGSKAELVQRIAACLQDYEAQLSDESLTEDAAVADDTAADVDQAAEQDSSLGDIDMEELMLELEAEFAGHSKQELIAALQNRGLSAEGVKAELVTRLAQAVAREELGSIDAAVSPGLSAAPYSAPASQQPPQQPAAAEAPADREWLIADKQQAMLEELLQMGVQRQELIDILSELGQQTSEEETLEELAERASWLLAEEEVLLIEQQRASEGGAAEPGTSSVAQEALANSPSSVLDTVTATDINKMKVDELKLMLRQLGLSDEGSRYVLRDRLMTMFVVRRAATAGDMDHLLQQLAEMTLSELRAELERRGLSLSGSKAALEMRLAQALVVEIMGGDAAAAAMQMQMGGTPQEEEEMEALGNPLLEDYDEVETAIADPAVKVALICGIASTHSSNNALTPAAKLLKVTEALATATNLLDELHTAPLDPQQAAAMAAGETAADDGDEPRPIPACGITVDVYWADAYGVFYQLPAAMLSGMAPADVAGRAAALATAQFADAEALARHLAASNTNAAMSVLPGGALAMSGQLSAACSAAGVALAAGGPLEGTNKVLSGGREPVLGGRSVVLQELKALGYPTLPLLQINKQELLDNAEQLARYLAKVLEAEEEEMSSPAVTDPVSLVDDDDETGVHNSSEILRSWNAAAGSTEQQHTEAVIDAADGVQQAQEASTVVRPAVVQRIADWCDAEGLDAEQQLFTLGSAAGGEPLACATGLDRVVEQLVNVFAQDDSLSSLLIEPLYRKLVRWEVVVVGTAEDGPVALVPAELEHYNVLQQLEDADLALKEWAMMQAGMEEEDIDQVLNVESTSEPAHMETLSLPSLPAPLPGCTLKFHVPPRASTKITMTIRHAAAKAVAQLGLERAGLVRVNGWLALRPDWQELYTMLPEDIKQMPDWDADQLLKVYEDKLAQHEVDPAPLVEYYNEDDHIADLTKFDPAQRCASEFNGEADVLLRSVELDVPLHSTSIASIQALEAGLGPGGLARHLVNLALLHKESHELLPPPHPPLTDSSAQWAQASGANDDVDDVMMQLALQKVEDREAEDHVREQNAIEAERSSFAALPWDEAVQDVLSGLTSQWLTEEQLAQPPQDPEEWQPQFDTRTQDDINAERDALRAPEDLAARDLRDEGLPHYGDQPIKYDRYDSGDEWVPPAIVAAQAAAEGKPIPSIADFQREEDERQELARQQMLNGPYSDSDRLPQVSEDEVLYYRLLGPDRYKGGVQAALQQSREWQKDSRTQIALSAQKAAEAAVQTGAEVVGPPTAAPQPVVSGTVQQDNWPYPSEKELTDEIESRQAAPRIWVLMGGDGLDRQRCFRNGANIVAKLQRCQDLQVDAFLLPPAGAGLDEVKRRAALIARRTEWQALGIPEDIYPESMSDAALIDMEPTDVAALSRSITVLSPQHLARHTVEEAIESAERAAARSRISYAAAPVIEKHQLDSQYESQMELEAHYIEGVGSSWGGASAGVLSPPARTLNLEEFLLEASSCGATVILAADDSLTASGQLQQLLEAAGVGYAGMTSDFAYKCSNRLALSKAIDDIVEGLALSAGYSPEDLAVAQEEDSSVSSLVGMAAIPKKVFKTQELLTSMEKVEDHDIMFEALFDGWDCKSVVIKPSVHSSGMGNIRIATADDLVLLTLAMREGAPRVLPNRLSLQPEGASLPMSLPELLVVEPWMETDAVGAVIGADGDVELQWEGSSRWVEVSVGLLGELGSMIALEPTMLAPSTDGAGQQQFTPPPEHIVPSAAVEAVQGYAVALADGLGLRSIACVDGFVNVDNGEFIVMDVKPNPPLVDGSPIFQQALVHDPPLLPYQLFRYLAQQALISAEAVAEAEAAAADLSSSSSSLYAPAEAGSAGFDTEDFDFGNASADDMFGGSSGFGGDEVADGGVEDEDVEGLAAGWTR